MRKTSVFIIMGILLVSLASAEMTLNIGVASDEVDVNIDGLNFDNTVNQIWSQDERWSGGMDDMHIYHLFDSVADLINGEYDRDNVNLYRDEEMLIAGALNRAFATKKETNYLYGLISQLSIRIEALEKTIEEIAGDEYCKQKIDVTLSHGLHSVNCEDTRYHNAQINGLAGTGFSTIGIRIKDVKEEQEEVFEEEFMSELQEEIENEEEMSEEEEAADESFPDEEGVVEEQTQTGVQEETTEETVSAEDLEEVPA